MRAFVFAIALAACTPPQAQKSEQQNAPPQDVASTAQMAPVGEPMATGLMGGFSETSTGALASLEIAPDRLGFSSGFEEVEVWAPTEFLGVLDPAAAIVSGGDSFTAAISNTTVTRVEVRRLVGAAPEQLCAGVAPSYVALVHAEPLTVLHLMVFTGADAPGPNAHDSALCAIYGYAPD